MRTLIKSLVTLGLLVTVACGENSPSTNSGKGGSGPSGGAGGSAGSTATGGTTQGGTAGAAGISGVGGNPAKGGSTGSGGLASAGGSTGTVVSDAGSSPVDAGVIIDGSAGSDAVYDPKAPCPRCVKIFDGTSFDGWGVNKTVWKLVDGAMHGQGEPSRAAYTNQDYGNVRLFVTSRLNPVNGDHLGILFWGNHPTNPDNPPVDGAGWLQWMPPFGGMWSYHPGGGGLGGGIQPKVIGKVDVPGTTWHTSELLLNFDKGTLRAAVNGTETTQYTFPYPTEHTDPKKRIVKGPIAMMRHGGGGSEYKDIWVEVEPTEDKLYSVK